MPYNGGAGSKAGGGPLPPPSQSPSPARPAAPPPPALAAVTPNPTGGSNTSKALTSPPVLPVQSLTTLMYGSGATGGTGAGAAAHDPFFDDDEEDDDFFSGGGTAAPAARKIQIRIRDKADVPSSVPQAVDLRTAVAGLRLDASSTSASGAVMNRSLGWVAPTSAPAPAPAPAPSPAKVQQPPAPPPPPPLQSQVSLGAAANDPTQLYLVGVGGMEAGNWAGAGAAFTRAMTLLAQEPKSKFLDVCGGDATAYDPKCTNQCLAPLFHTSSHLVRPSSFQVHPGTNVPPSARSTTRRYGCSPSPPTRLVPLPASRGCTATSRPSSWTTATRCC